MRRSAQEATRVERMEFMALVRAVWTPLFGPITKSPKGEWRKYEAARDRAHLSSSRLGDGLDRRR